MIYRMKSLLIGGIGALLLVAGGPAHAQNSAAPVSAPPPTVSQPPLQDFRLPGRTVVPQQQAPAPVVVAPPPPVTTAPRPQTATPTRQAPQREAPAAVQQQAPALPAPITEAAPAPSEPTAVPIDSAPVPAPVQPAEAPEEGGLPWLTIAPAAAALALLAFLLIRRRRARADEDEAYQAPAIEAPAAPAPRPTPAPRPWLELELKAERLSSTDVESVVNFDLEIVNNGQAPARNLRIDVKMFNAGTEQDKEIGAFFRTAGRENTKCSLPGIAPGTTGAIKGSVGLRRDEMKAVQLENRYLFIPMIAVNALYDYGDGQTGQTSKSYVVGRELEQPNAKMGAFRVDLGPRVWRTVGQRQHKLARRV
jgi:hypothetical protein